MEGSVRGRIEMQSRNFLAETDPPPPPPKKNNVIIPVGRPQATNKIKKDKIKYVDFVLIFVIVLSLLCAIIKWSVYCWLIAPKKLLTIVS